MILYSTVSTSRFGRFHHIVQIFQINNIGVIMILNFGCTLGWFKIHFVRYIETSDIVKHTIRRWYSEVLIIFFYIKYGQHNKRDKVQKHLK